MKKLLTLTAIVAGLASSSAAGTVDAIIAAEPVVAAPVPQITDWSGPYFGAHTNSDGGTLYRTDLAPPATYGDDLFGSLHGGFAGYSFQHGSLVFGAEVAYSLGPLAANIFTGRRLGEFSNFTDLKARVGFATGNALIYAVGGASTSTWTFVSMDPIHPAGFNYGVGAEFLVSDRIFIGVEYLVRQLADDFIANPNSTMGAHIQSLQLRAGMRF